MSIAVVIPAYNASSFLAETLESVLRQSLAVDEILVVDDGSTDDTVAVASTFAPAVRVVSISNSGTGTARNFGVEQVDAEWIAFLDHDDVWDENKLGRQMEELRQHPEAELCYCGHVPFSASAGVNTLGRAVPGCPASVVRRRLMENFAFLPSSVVLRKSAMQRVGGFNPDRGVADDWELWLRLMHAGVQFVGCAEPLLRYRVHSSSITANRLRLLMGNRRVYREQVVPHLKNAERWLAPARYFSRHDVDIAYLLRQEGDPRCLAVMTASILRWPFGDPKRYKSWCHMLLARLRRELRGLALGAD